MSQPHRSQHGSSTRVSILALIALVASCSGTAVIDGDGHGAGASSPSGDCSERIRQVACRADPPECGSGTFPGALPDDSCWSGACLDCVEHCQRDEDCVVVTACGCSYHEGCSFAETRYQAAQRDSCFGSPGRPCSATCPSSVCSTLDCPWCSADAAECVSSTCRSIVNHPCY